MSERPEPTRWKTAATIVGPIVGGIGDMPFLLADGRNFSPAFTPPPDAVIYDVIGFGDASAPLQLPAETALAYHGEDCNPYPGWGAGLFEVLEGQLAGSYVRLDRKAFWKGPHPY